MTEEDRKIEQIILEECFEALCLAAPSFFGSAKEEMKRPIEWTLAFLHHKHRKDPSCIDRFAIDKCVELWKSFDEIPADREPEKREEQAK